MLANTSMVAARALHTTSRRYISNATSSPLINIPTLFPVNIGKIPKARKLLSSRVVPYGLKIPRARDEWFKSGFRSHMPHQYTGHSRLPVRNFEPPLSSIHFRVVHPEFRHMVDKWNNSNLLTVESITHGEVLQQLDREILALNPLEFMNRNKRKPKKANHGARPCSSVSRKKKALRRHHYAK